MIKLAEIFQSGMVLQREKELSVWGRADPGAEISLCIQGQTGSACADGAGQWLVKVPPLHASESETLTVSCGADRLQLEDVAVGEVWIAGGQSNMEFHMRYEAHLAQVKPGCANPRIRFYDQPETAYPGQKEQFDYSRMGLWRKAGPEQIEYFSAAGYYFARDLEQALDVPVGIVGCNWGGTVCAAWMDPATVRKAGPVWMEEYDAFCAKTDLDGYFAKQKDNFMNDRGNPFAYPFSEFVMPKTRTVEDLARFFAPLGSSAPVRPDELLVQNLPGALYENMVKKVAPFPARGVLWYQGESDDKPGRQGLYQAMLTGMIGDWRKLWGEALPFLIVQLPGFEHWLDNQCLDYAAIREGQRQVTKTVPNTWLCSISDAGEQWDIHPKNKQVVGQRLALLAERHCYGLPVLADAPEALSLNVEGNRIEIPFANAGRGLVCRGETVAALSVRADGEEVPFRAQTAQDRLVLTVGTPLRGKVQVRHAQGSWYQVNLYNEAGVPALPFLLTVQI